MSTVKHRAALAGAVLVAALSLTGCVQQADDERPTSTPGSEGTTEQATFPYPPVQHQHRAE